MTDSERLERIEDMLEQLTSLVVEMAEGQTDHASIELADAIRLAKQFTGA